MRKLLALSALICAIGLALISCGGRKGGEHIHSFGEWRTVVETGCTSDGKIERVCSCGESETEIIKAPGHIMVDAVCSLCGRGYSRGLELISNGNGSCYVNGIGSCTDSYIIIPPASNDGESVIGIGDNAFFECNAPTAIIIPDEVTYIGDAAFYGCSSLVSIDIPKNVTHIGDSAFLYCTSLASINVEQGNQAYMDIDGNLYDLDGSVLIQYAVGKTADSFVFPDGVVKIGEFAFSGASGLNSITLSRGLSEIGDFAFSQCFSLTSIEIPVGVTRIGRSAFYECNRLTSIALPYGTKQIGDDAFAYCASLVSIAIPDSLSEVGEGAFSDCRLLTDVYYGGDSEQWGQIEINAGNYYLEKAAVHCNASK